MLALRERYTYTSCLLSLDSAFQPNLVPAGGSSPHSAPEEARCTPPLLRTAPHSRTAATPTHSHQARDPPPQSGLAPRDRECTRESQCCHRQLAGFCANVPCTAQASCPECPSPRARVAVAGACGAEEAQGKEGNLPEE